MSLYTFLRISSKNRIWHDFVWNKATCLTCTSSTRASSINHRPNLRWFYQSAVNCKRRKTAEEKKASVLAVEKQIPKFGKNPSLPPIQIWRNITVQDLALSLDRKIGDVFEAMCFINDTASYSKPNSIIDNPSVVKEVVKKCGRKYVIVSPPSDGSDVERDKDVVRQPPPDPACLVKRPPVVAIMGHVDHGKTTLLDSLRNTRVVDSEFGGITQHIGAFTVSLKTGEKITFLDTPGHAAFSAMRARGAEATDIVVLVVAADDGVMEQTVESIKMASNAGVAVIVAMNKMDKPNVDPERVKRELSLHGVQVEDLGGDVQVIPISAIKGTNLDVLVEAIVLQADLMDLNGDPRGLVEGVVIESKTDPRRGKLSTAIVKRGTMRKGTVLVAGTAWAKVRVMMDEEGQTVDEAGPSAAVQVLGWRELPSAGDEILEVQSERVATDVVRWREQQKLLKRQEQDVGEIKKKTELHLVEYKAQLDKKRQLGYRRLKPTGPREKQNKNDYRGPQVNVIIKGDVDGSVEAILDVIESYDCSNECKLSVVHYGVGFVTESDIDLADTFNAIIYSFNVDSPANVKKLAKTKDLKLRSFNVIYRLIEDLKKELNAQLPAKDVEEIVGEANVLQHFEVTEGKKKVPVAGCRCAKGELRKSLNFRVLRDGEVLYDGKVDAMKHLKNEVNTIKKDVDCGLMFADFPHEFNMGDTIICYEMKSIPQVTSWDPGF